MNALIHPALLQLAKMRMRGRLRSMVASFTQPRKLFVSILGTILAAVWLSNVIASILLRENYNPEVMRLWITLMLTLYAGWHFVRVSWQRPESSIEWSETEKNNLLPSPFTREELVQYRLVTVLGATTLKAGIGATLLLPDLPLPWLGFIALWFALAFVELIRLNSDTLAAGLGSSAFRLFRGTVVLVVASLGVSFSYIALTMIQSTSLVSQVPIVFQFGVNLFSVVKSSIQSPVGAWISAPFGLFVDIMMSAQLTAHVLLMTVAGFSIIVVAIWTLLWLDRWSQRAITFREKQTNCIQQELESKADLSNRHLPKRIVMACGGAVVWRQCVGAYRYGTGVLLALVPPAILAAMPLLMTRLSDRMAVVNFLGGLVFYSFLLLPSAMKFDFRRDYSHLLLLKMLPLSPWRVVVGQMITPILITTFFQYAMLGVACAIRGMETGILTAALLSFPAMNFAVYGWENLMFLIFPQKLKQEGVEVFLRTTVIFTAKGLTCAIVFLLLFLWAMVSAEMARGLGQFIPVLADRRLVFGIGVWCSISALGLLMTILAARQFRSLDAFPETQV